MAGCMVVMPPSVKWEECQVHEECTSLYFRMTDRVERLHCSLVGEEGGLLDIYSVRCVDNAV